MRKLKISNLSNERFDNEDLSKIKGGDVGGCNMACCCACRYENQGGSTTSGNYNANDSSQLSSPGCWLD